MSLKINKSDKILIVAPHPDDETIGCGGLLSLYGNQCDVLLITDGRMGYFDTCNITDPEKVAEVRRNEFYSVMSDFNVNDSFLLEIPNENISPFVKRIKKFDLRKYTKIFIPGSQEHHHEHRLVNRIIRRMIILQFAKAQLFEYEVWTPLVNPNYLLDIGDVINQKMNAVGKYKSQLECYDYISLTHGLNTYRGCTNLLSYAEVYNHRWTFRTILKHFYRKIKFSK